MKDHRLLTLEDLQIRKKNTQFERSDVYLFIVNKKFYCILTDYIKFFINLTMNLL
jgi:hypothetical protein